MKYTSYLRNHAVYPGSEKALHTFLNATLDRNGKKEKHKLKHCCSSNSEDALTWSCFDVLRQKKKKKIASALNEIMEDAFEGKVDFLFENEQNIEIHIGKNYSANTTEENTELDASIETADKLIFVEAKLYSKISLPDNDTPYDQIIRKLRVGLDVAKRENKKFYFIFLDIWNMFPNKLQLHTSGHASAATLIEVCQTVNPTTAIIPIHSQCSDDYKKLPLPDGLKAKIITESAKKQGIEIVIDNKNIKDPY
jgi:hypothetical protein